MASKLSEKAKTYLQGRHFGVLATINKDGTPQQSAMWYRLDGDTIIMNTRVGRVKERNMRRDPRVSLCFEQGGYLTLKGRVELLDEPQEATQQEIYRLAVRYDGEEEAKKAMEAFSQQQRVTIRMTIESVIESLR